MSHTILGSMLGPLILGNSHLHAAKMRITTNVTFEVYDTMHLLQTRYHGISKY